MVKSPKKWLILTQYYPPEMGAPQIRLSEFAKELRALGHQVKVLTGMPNYPSGIIHKNYKKRLWMKEKIANIDVMRVWLYPAAGKKPFKRLMNYLSFTCTATLAILMGASKDVDIVFVEAQPITLAIPALYLKYIKKIPYIYNTPDLQIENAHEDKWIGLSLLIRAARQLESFLMRQSLSVSTVTHAFIEHFHKNRGIPYTQLSFFPNGADTQSLKKIAPDIEYQISLGIAQGKKIFTYAGTHAHYQGLETIIQAANIIKDRTDIVVVMVGQGPVRDTLIKMAQEQQLSNIIFTQSPFSDMAKLMSFTTAALVVLKNLPSSEKMRLSKTIPPLACGVPVIYAGKGESAQLLNTHHMGITVAPEDPQALAKSIVYLADNKEQVRQMGVAGQNYVCQHLSWSVVVSNWLKQIDLSLVHASNSNTNKQAKAIS